MKFTSIRPKRFYGHLLAPRVKVIHREKEHVPSAGAKCEEVCREAGVATPLESVSVEKLANPVGKW